MSQDKPKLELVKTRLEKVDSRTIKSERKSGERLRMLTEWNYVINKKTSDFVVISATCRTRFVPEGLFEILSEFSLVYRCREDISRDQIENNMESLLFPAGEQNALLVAQLTDKMRGSPMVISPKVKLQGDMNLN
ncbi:hypothetical protein [Natranaerobius thermophilus]|uniref:Uncharacterized protein n=1 Tax=Natranaerobius thermophilus (strain ATCC BAA-1301 / DSM 18059 / JW/NM-WN-LF) TaxID=457570 RepID=B2A828_NATTJ|nr:hypothetical protein [Natranaerobius thermophilus]ACB85826.1 hypothetical protein Nther_2260 [Natranaerobius thermophilus JW/NM-WN-LF]